MESQGLAASSASRGSRTLRSPSLTQAAKGVGGVVERGARWDETRGAFNRVEVPSIARVSPLPFRRAELVAEGLERVGAEDRAQVGVAVAGLHPPPTHMSGTAYF